MKVGIFDPYLDTIGGGERYMMTIAEYLSQQGHQVDVFWQDKNIKKKIERRLNFDLSGINFCSFEKNVLKRLKIGRNYNLLFYLSDGSIPFLFAKKNILHFQVPFHGVGGKSLWNKIKLRLIDKIICNSYFTKRFIDQEYGVDSVVIYPPVDVENFQPAKKEDLILSVGRFDSPLHAKRQDVLIRGFKRIRESGWRLILAGGAENEGGKYLEKLRKMAQGLSIEILLNVDFETLQKLYGKAKIYWHAAGFGVDEEKEPEKVEHFGITTVEAMAAGCVPVVIKKGGQGEIVKHGINGFLWETKEELIKYTVQLIKEEKSWQKLSAQAIQSAQKFSKERFYEEIKQIIS